MLSCLYKFLDYGTQFYCCRSITHLRKCLFVNSIVVSVIIPAYHCADTILQALDSALIQDVPLEVILIDDDPHEDLSALVHTRMNDGRVRYYRNNCNLGVAASRNRGVQLARGEYIAFLDCDDRWLPGKLQKQLALLQQTNAPICSTARELITQDGISTGYVIPVRERFTYRNLLRQNLINCSSVLMPTAIAREFPMRCDADSHEDYLMWLEILQKYGWGCAVNEPLLQYRVSTNGKSGGKLHSAKMTFRTYRHMGFGVFHSCLYFAHYSLNGMHKYLGWFMKRRLP